MNLRRGVRWLMATLAIVGATLSRADCFDRYQRLPQVLRIRGEPVSFFAGNSIPAWHLSWEMARSRATWTPERATTHRALGCFEFFWNSEGKAEFPLGSVIPERVAFTADAQQTEPFFSQDDLYLVVGLDSLDNGASWRGAWRPIDSEEIGSVWTGVLGLYGYALRLRFDADGAVGIAYYFNDEGEGSSTGLRIVAQRIECGERQ